MLHIFNAPRSYPRTYAPHCETFNFYDDRDAWLRSIESIPEPAVHLFAVHWMHLEVYNGGFWQYFFNSTGTTAPEAVAGFRAIGMPAVADLCEAAMSRVGSPYPFETDKRRELVGGPGDRADFGDLDDRFYELADTEKVFRRQPRFVPFAEAYAAEHFPAL